MNSKKNQVKNHFETVVEEYKRLLKDKTAPENQTMAYHKNVDKTVIRLVEAADALDTEAPGQGIFGLIMLGLMTNLKLKDRLTENEVKIRELEREIRRLKKR
jgi:hypothetical protein